MILSFLFSLFLFPSLTFASSVSFVTDPIWFSPEPVVEGQKVTVHTQLYNGESVALSATAFFFDGKVVLGQKPVTLPALSSKDITILWTPTAGAHDLSVSLVNATLDNREKTPVTLDPKDVPTLRVVVPKKLTTGGDDTTPTFPTIQKGLDTVSEKVSDILPDPVEQKLDSVFSTVDDFRTETATSIELKRQEYKQNIKDAFDADITNGADAITNKGEMKDVQLKKPLAYVGLFFMTLFGFIFKIKAVFYIVGCIILYIIIRKIFRLFKKKEE